MKFLYSTIILAMAGLALGSHAGTESSDDVLRDQVITAANSFAIDLYQAVRGAAGNQVVSPLSAAVALALLWTGAGGRTAEQLATALRLHSADGAQRVARGFGSLLEDMPTSPAGPASSVLQNNIMRSRLSLRNDRLTLKIANKIFVQRGFSIKDSFRQTAVNHFKSAAEEVDFANDTEPTRQSVNQWVEQNTDGKIKDLFTPGQLSSSSVLVLVNAIYFKGTWFNTFEEDDTRSATFHVNSTNQIEVPTMHGSFQANYGIVPELNATVLELPYRTNNRHHHSQMLVFLPNAIDGLENLESKLGEVDINSIATRRYDVTVTLPKFRIEATHNLKDKLTQLGATDVFSSAADLSGLSDVNTYVSDAVQKTFIEVNEKGTEAAAATGVNVALMSLFPQAEFKANHPFLFVLRKGNIILFIGRVANPSN